MSCSIDHRGSILMEFVLVLPIYLALLGGLFLVGDMGLMALGISIGDRDAAMDAGDRSGHSMGPFLSQQMNEEAGKVLSDSRTYRVDEEFRRPWAWQSAGRVSFAYRLQSWGGGLLSYPFLRYGDVTSGGGILGTLVGGGAVVFHGKDFSFSDKVRTYNYYTLKRIDVTREPDSYRNWDSWDNQGRQDTSRNHLVDSTGGFGQYWWKYVCDEKSADPRAEQLDESHQDALDESRLKLPSGRAEYKRFEQFVIWSQ